MAPFSLSHTSLQDYERHLSLLAGNDAYFLDQSSDFLLEEVVLTGSASSVAFSNLDQYASTYQHLQIRYAARDTGASTTNNMGVRFNGVSTASYSHHRLYANGSSVTAYSTGALNTFMLGDGLVGGGSGAGAFTGGVIDIIDPFETTKNTTIRVLCGFAPIGSNQAIELVSGAYYSTDAISSVQFFPLGSTSFAQYSRFSLYGSK